LLRNPEKTGLYVVTIPTELAIDKTVDMMNSLQNLGILSRGLLMNHMTPVNECVFCYSRSQRQAIQIARAREVFSNQPQVGIFRQTDPTGLTRLTSLGHALYQKTITV